MRARFVVAVCLAALIVSSVVAAETVRLTGRIKDADTGEVLPARVYLQNADGKWFFVQAADAKGTAVVYDKARSATSVERHTTVSAHGFAAHLPRGKYTLTVERGKEYMPAVVSGIDLTTDGSPRDLDIRLRRWIDMNRLGWYSGETHVHRSVAELPNVMLAEDLNVALPLTYWVTKSDTPPASGDKNTESVKAELIHVDPTHVIYPMNTEYEIFTVAGKRHTLGAVFALNHKSVLKMGAPPVAPIAAQVRREGGLLELDKHNWPWSMMLVPVMNVDLYELTNNHVWRTNFHFSRFGEAPPDYMKIEHNDQGMTENGWIDFTFQNYYALLNCGFRMRPTAGTASGVHPVPLGYGRVYVHLGDKFSYEAWIDGLDKGRSFVTTGPMLEVRVNDHLPGHSFRQSDGETKYRIAGWARSARPLSHIEIVSAGRVVQRVNASNKPMESGGFESQLDVTLPVDGSTWLAVRCWQPFDDERSQFAHTAPWHIDVTDKPLAPRAEEVQYLIDRMQAELNRNADVLPEAALDEFRAALKKYSAIPRRAN